MVSIKNVIEGNFVNALHQLRAAVDLGEITEKDLIEGENVEKQIAEKTAELHEKEKQLEEKETEILAKYPKHHLENQFKDITYGTWEWFDKKQQTIQYKSEQVPFLERKKILQEKAEIIKEREDLNISLEVSMEKFLGDLNHVKSLIQAALSAIEHLKQNEKSVNVDSLEEFLNDNIGWVNMMEEAATKLADSLKKGVKKQIYEDLSAVNSIRELLDIDDNLISKIKDEIDQINKKYILKKSNVFREYNIFCTHRARRNFSNPTLMALFKNKILRILDMWKKIKSIHTGAWHYIGQSEVARGELTDSVRIIYEIQGKNIYVYDICFHPEYDHLLGMLKDGRYKKMKTPVMPLMEFYPFEAMAA